MPLFRKQTSGSNQEDPPVVESDAPAPAPVPAPSQAPEFGKLGKGAAHFEFSGSQHAAKKVTHTQMADGALTTWVHEAKVSGQAVKNRFHGEESADVRYQHADIEAREDDLDMYIKGGQSKWITGQTKESVMKMKRGGLFRLWEVYRESGRNASISGFTRDALEEDYPNTPEGLEELKDFVLDYLAVTHGEEAG